MMRAEKACPPEAADTRPEGGEGPPRTFEQFSKLFRDGCALRTASEAIYALGPVPWAVLLAIYHFLWGAPEAWPSQATIAARAGFCERSVRRGLRALERARLIVTRRVPRGTPFGGFHNVYGPGPALMAALVVLYERMVDRAHARALADEGVVLPRAKPLFRARGATGPTVLVQPAPQSEDLDPSRIASMPFSLGEDASAEAKPPTPPAPPVLPPTEEEDLGSIEVGEGEKALARDALAYRLARKFPKAKVPTWFDGADVARIARCVAELDGDAAEKRAALYAAVDGAFLVSKDRAPTVRFIFGKLEHFHAHVERGERKRKNDALNAAHKAKVAAETAAIAAEQGATAVAETPTLEASVAKPRLAAPQPLQAPEGPESRGTPTLTAPPAERGVGGLHEALAAVVPTPRLRASPAPAMGDEVRREAELRAESAAAEQARRADREHAAERARREQRAALLHLVREDKAQPPGARSSPPAASAESEHRAAVRAEMEAMLATITNPQLRARLLEQLQRARERE
jgi:hypothetical protein